MDVNSLGLPWDDNVGAFTDAAGWLVELSAPATAALNQPGLGEWSVRDLLGHTSRAVATVEAYLSTDDLPVDTATATDYFAIAGLADPAAIAERGRRTAAELGPDPTTAIRDLVRRVVALVGDQSADARVRTPAGTMTLAEYLPTRTFELVVHGCDLAVALGLPPVIPATAARSATRLAADLAVTRGSAAPALHALTGRSTLPAGFTLL